MRSLFLSAIIVACVAIAAPAQIWEENFDNPALEGKGVAGGTPPTTNMIGVTTFTVDTSGATLAAGDWFVVTNSHFEGVDLDGQAVWQSVAVNISTYPLVGFSLSAIEVGDHEATDYFDVEYQVDGGGFTLVTNWNGKGSATHTLVGDIPDDGDWLGETVTVYGIVGNLLQLRVSMDNDAGTERLSLDDVVIHTNLPPANVAPAIVPIGDKAVVVGSDLSFDVVASDPVDGDSITLFATDIPTGATFPSNSAIASITGTFNWVAASPAGVYTTTFWAVDTDGSSSETIEITVEPTPPSTVLAFINEVEPNGAGTDSNDFVEIIAPAGTNLLGCFLVHHNGSASGDGELWRFDFPSFIVPDDGVTDTNGTSLGFCVIAQPGGGVANVDFDLPSGNLQSGPDGVILYDASSNIIDAVAWAGAGDLADDDPGTVTTSGDPSAPNFLHVTPNESGGTSSMQAPDNVLGDDGSGWAQLPVTPGAINGGQTTAQINLTEGAVANPAVVEITDPAIDPLDVANGIVSYDVKGTASTGTIGQISWTNDATGASGTIAAATNWTVATVALNVGANLITVSGTNATGNASVDSVTIRRGAPAMYDGTIDAMINEIEFNGAGADSNDFIEIIAPAGTDLENCFLIDYNGDDGSDGGATRMTIPAFIVPDDGITDTEGTPLGFFVLSDVDDPAPNTDATMPDGFQNGPDGIVLYDSLSNILDAVAYEGPGDLATDDPGTLIATGDTEADNFLHVTVDDGGTPGTNTVQAPNNVLGDTGAGWLLIGRTPGAINGNQTNGDIRIVSGGMGPGDVDGDGIPDDYETEYSGTATGLVANADIDGDGKINIDEYIADTVPTNGASFFDNIITNPLVNAETIVLVAGPPTTNSRVYDAWVSTDLENDTWTPLNLDVDGSDLGTAVLLTVTNNLGQGIYRTGVKLP